MRKVLFIIFIVVALGAAIFAGYKFLGEKFNPENRRIEAWISTNNLNQYGDPENTAYSGGTPLFNETTGQRIDRYDYIKKMHPDKPWEK